ncbi:MAG: hypothetical protein IKD04_00430 [Clostridia bacterium]|nr:hypothetical protein [Clostridia bacterium]
MTVTFFGHRITPNEIKPRLMLVLRDLIENSQADTFYVGNQGDFDRLVRQSLRELEKQYPHIRYNVVLAYMPIRSGLDECRDFSDTIYPEGLEAVSPKNAIDRRNRWMLEKCDCAVVYITGVGNASTYGELAEKMGKTVINIAEK